jgi:ATP-dependent DNA helicase RecG
MSAADSGVTGPLAREDLAALLADGEDSFTEFKDARATTRDIAKELCAFLNANGGRVLIGVDDDDTRLHDASNWEEERVMNVARTLIDPAIVPTYQRIQWDAKTVVVVVGVERGPEKPYAVSPGEGRRYYMRVGSTSREATREELIRLTQASGAVSSDLRPVLGATLDDLDGDLLAQRFAGHRSLDFQTLTPDERRRILTDAEILHRDTGGPTIGGLLCFGVQPTKRLPYSTLSCSAFPGTVVSRELRDRVEIDGRVDEQVRRAIAFIRRALPQPSDLQGAVRVERPMYREESLREVVANAVAHRHYGIAGPINVRLFADRLEVVSPGAPPNGVTPDSMRVGVSVRRNQFITNHLVEHGLVDAVGRGIVLLFDEAAALELPEPRIAVSDTWTTVTLPFV